jgi:acyl-CoA reductase-like NAD-dependent aldehyde dehydrogenase
VKEFIADAQARGKVVAGGKALERDGYFIAPTIVRDIPDDARVVREEPFGPVLPVLKYSDVSDAVARVNSTEYGLGGSVWSSNPRAIHSDAHHQHREIVRCEPTIAHEQSRPGEGDAR